MKTSFLFLLAACVAGAQQTPARGASDDVMKVDEAYRMAKLNRDVRTLDRILADGFNETNQNGNSRNKAQTLELWTSFSISSLTTDSSEVRLAGTTARVMGTQTEDHSERMLFTRVYVKNANGWQLLASMQMRNPNAPVSQLRGADAEVMKADEAFRLAKVKQDVKALDAVLEEGFSETNQNGSIRNKTEMIDLFKSFRIGSLTTDTVNVQRTGDTAMVTGTQTEDQTHMLFTRVYVKTAAGWKLFSSMQTLNGNQNGAL